MINITYLIFAHSNPKFLQHLITRLQSPQTDFFIHIDSKSKEDFSIITSMSNVFFAKKTFNIEWGGISMVEALLSACSELSQVCKGDIVIFLSGTDYPAKSNLYINNFLERHKNTNFINGYQIPSSLCNWQEGGRRRIECYALRLQERCIATIEPKKLSINNLKQFFKTALKKPTKIPQFLKIFCTYPQRKHPQYLTPYGGEFWWILPTSSVKRILRYVETHLDFLNYHKYTSIPDELFFNTIVYNIFTKEEISNDCLRYIKWGNQPSPEHITINETELIQNCIKRPNILFLRKIDSIETCQFIDNLCKNL